MSQLKPPIFLIGNVRSGTSLIHDLFDCHPDVKSWYEPRTVWVYADPDRRHDRFDASDATDKVTRYIRKRFLNYQETHGGLRVMEKTPSNIMRIPYVRSIFPEAKFLYVIREPLANLSSAELRWQRPIHLRQTWHRLKEVPKSQLHHYVSRYFIDHFRKKVLRQKYVSIWGVRYPGIYDDIRRYSVDQIIAKQWVACAQQAEADLADMPDSMLMRIRYEDFVRQPVEVFRSICTHFELTMTDQLKRTLVEQVDTDRQMKWKRLNPDVIKRSLPILKADMLLHGYSIPAEFTDELGVESGTDR